MVVLTLVLLQGYTKHTAASPQLLELPTACQFLCSSVLVHGDALWAHRVFPLFAFLIGTQATYAYFVVIVKAGDGN